MKELETGQEPEPGAQMSFLEHLDELRKRLVRAAIILVVTFLVCFYFSEPIYNFLSVPIRRALNEASRQNIPLTGLQGDEGVIAVSNLKDGDSGRYMFSEAANMGGALILPGPGIRRASLGCLLPSSY